MSRAYGGSDRADLLAWWSAEVQKPGASGGDVISLAPGAGDRYVASYPLPVPGLYRIRVRATGDTMYCHPFEREQTLTAVAVQVEADAKSKTGRDAMRLTALAETLKGRAAALR